MAAPDFVTRPYQPGDAEAIAALSNATSVHAGGHGGMSAAMVADYAHRLRDPGTDSREVFSPDGELVADGWVVPPPAGGHIAHLRGGVHPAWRGRGLGRELLAWQLARAAELRRELAPDAPGGEVHAGAMVGDKDAARLFRRCGLRPVRYWFHMVAPTAGAAGPAADPPDGLRVVDYQRRYEAGVHQAHQEAFADHWGYQLRSLEEWAPLTVRSARFAPQWSLVALAGDEVAGYSLGYESTDPDEAYIGQVGVRRAWRRRGLAATLMTGALARAARDGKGTASLSVDADSLTGAVGVYERVGFTVDTRAVTYAMIP